VSTTGNTETIEVITRDQRRRRRSLAEKSALVRRTYEPGMSVSLVARQEGVAASLLFQWRKPHVIARSPARAHCAAAELPARRITARLRATDYARDSRNCARRSMAAALRGPPSDGSTNT
jgi:transposase-like protein